MCYWANLFVIDSTRNSMSRYIFLFFDFVIYYMFDARMKISVLTDISVLGFYGYIGYIGDISMDIFT